MSRRKNAKTRGQVFISHTNRVPRDKNYSLCLKRALEYLGLKVFLDNEYSWGAKTLAEAISSELVKSGYYIPVLSLQALKRPWVNYEINLAINLYNDLAHRGLIIIPFFLEDCSKEVDRLRPFPPVWAYHHTFSEILMDLLKQKMGLRFSPDRVASATQLYNPRKPTLARWLTRIAPDNDGNPFVLTPDEEKGLEVSCTDPELRDKLANRLQQFLHKNSLAEITVGKFQEKIESALIHESRGTPRRMFRLCYLLFREAALRCAKGDREKMITGPDWEAALRKVGK